MDRILFALSVCLLVGATALGAARAVRTKRASDSWIRLGLAAWLAAAVFLAFRPGHASRLNLVPFNFGPTASLFDPVLNVCFFVPLGIQLATLGGRMRSVLGSRSSYPCRSR